MSQRADRAAYQRPKRAARSGDPLRAAATLRVASSLPRREWKGMIRNGYSAGVAAMALSFTGSDSNAMAGARLKPNRKTAMIA